MLNTGKILLDSKYQRQHDQNGVTKKDKWETKLFKVRDKWSLKERQNNLIWETEQAKGKDTTGAKVRDKTSQKGDKNKQWRQNKLIKPKWKKKQAIRNTKWANLRDKSSKRRPNKVK